MQGGGDQCADVNPGTHPEQDAVRVDQVDLPVGVEAPQDLGAVGVKYSVDRDRQRRGLDKVHRLLRRDVEALPVE